MILSELLRGLALKGSFRDVRITDVTDDSRTVTPGCLFVCIRGAHFDGHDAALQAVADGAAAVLAERETSAENEILVEDTRRAYAWVCANFYGRPSERLKLIGITGTNGKTSTAFLLKGIFDRLGVKSGLIGTVKVDTGGRLCPAVLTTPDSRELQRRFKEMVENGCTHCVMEVSSQALAQGRVEGCRFDLALFTNLTLDHLDYHKTFENYLAAKRRLFEQADTAILNMDDPAAEKLAEGLSCRRVTFSAFCNDADFVAKNVRCTASSVQYELLWNERIGRARVGIPGRFTVYNSMGAAVCAIEEGCAFEGVLAALAELPGVPGRMEVVPTGADYTVLIDYAHTPDALEKVLRSLRETAGGRLIAVFGCGGERDRTKRPLMGRIVGELADIAVVTSDNPRSEDPEAIIREVLAGMKGCKAVVRSFADRAEAIFCALGFAKAGDVVLLAGKGHEDYQVLKTGKSHFDEREVVARFLKEKK